MQKVMIFIDWFLPGFKAGGPVRSMANMVEHLNSDFEFYIVTRNTEYLETQPYTNVTTDSWNDFAPNTKVFYASKEKISQKQWRKLIRAIRPDTVYINGIYSPFFSMMPLYAAKLERIKKIIVAPRGMLAESAIGVKSFKKKLFLKLIRLTGLYKNVEWHVTNSKEGSEVYQVVNLKAQLFVAPNLSRKSCPDFHTVDKSAESVKLCSFARISPEKNTMFALQCLKKIPPTVKIQFDLYGEIYNAAYWQKCREIIDGFTNNITVSYSGVVDPSKVSDSIAQYHALFLPSRGENFGHVILESFMAGRPVIISNQTPWRNLAEQNAGWDLPLDESEFTGTIELLAQMQQSEYDKWCKGAFRLAAGIINDTKLLLMYKEMLSI
ncbi:MAG: glycosyltransferase [Cytophagaceae bacterium]|nr:glycosyltransferase [Cytophagaceae bacterium]